MFVIFASKTKVGYAPIEFELEENGFFLLQKLVRGKLMKIERNSVEIDGHLDTKKQDAKVIIFFLMKDSLNQFTVFPMNRNE